MYAIRSYYVGNVEIDDRKIGKDFGGDLECLGLGEGEGVFVGVDFVDVGVFFEIGDFDCLIEGEFELFGLTVLAS